jgi:hypothetical protein
VPNFTTLTRNAASSITPKTKFREEILCHDFNRTTWLHIAALN